MITAELISYISDQKKKGKTKENIVSELLSVGWALDDVQDGFKTIDGADKYREPITEDDVLDPDKPITDLNSFYPQKASVPVEEKIPEIKEEVTSPVGESLFFAKEKVAKADEPLPIEEEKKEPMVKAEGSLGKIGQVEEVKEEPIIPEVKIEEPIVPEAKTEPVIVPENNFIFPEVEKEKIPEVVTEPIKEGGRKSAPLGTYAINIPGVEFFDINGKKIETETEEEKVVEEPAKEETEISEFLKTTEPKKEEDEEVNLFRQMTSGLNQPKPNQEIKSDIVPEVVAPEISQVLPQETEVTSKVSRITIPLAKIPEQEKNNQPISEVIRKETQKVWTPMTVPAKVVEDGIYLGSEEGAIAHKNSNRMDEVKRFQEGLLKKDEKPQSEINPKDIYNDNPKEPSGLLQKQEMGSNFIPKKGVDSVGPIPSPEPVKNNISKVAMLSSFHDDLARVNQNSAITPNAIKPKKKKKGVKTLLFVLLFLSLIGAGFWAYSNGMINLNINLESLGISFIKKSPKELLLDYSNRLSSLNSYKSETNIQVISPSLANISRGLVSGEAIVSPEKDSININSIGTVSKNSGSIVSDSFITIKSTVFDDYINTDIKDDGTNLYVTIPNLENIVKDFIIKPSIVKINQEELSSFYSLLSPELEKVARKINLYKVLSKSIPSYINEKVLLAYNNLVTNIEVVEKGEENIKGINTYRYSITTDRESVKNLLMIVAGETTQDLSEEEQLYLKEILSSLDVSLFDVWVGKGDNNIYQYSVTASVPLSKILGFGDKSIGDNKVSVSWKTTYYDFEVANYIQTPNDFVLFLDYFNEMKKEKIKKELNYFIELASLFKKDINNYGTKSNTDGSCMNPVSGSLFSPTGHVKKASSSVGLISELLNGVMSETKNNGYCYSSSGSWAFAVPLASNYQDEEPVFSKYYCVDSAGNKLELDKKLEGTVCPIP